MSDRKSPLDQAVELFMYAPLGFVLEAPELVPKLIERGRQQVSMARVLGRFAVQHGEAQAGKQFSKLQEQAAATLAGLGLAFSQPDPPPSTRARPGRAASAPAPAPAPSRAGAATVLTTDGAAVVDVDVDPVVVAAIDPSALAIPDYDSLAASQVIPRLGGLSTPELEAVRIYESAGRGRKTILNKIAQLQAG